MKSGKKEKQRQQKQLELVTITTITITNMTSTIDNPVISQSISDLRRQWLSKVPEVSVPLRVTLTSTHLQKKKKQHNGRQAAACLNLRFKWA